MITHQKIKFVHSLKLKKNRSDFFVVEGDKMIHELLQSSFEIEHVFYTQDTEIKHPNSESVSTKDMDRMSHLKNASSVLAVVKKPLSNHKLDENNLQIVLDCISDPGNLGTIIRIADWFGIKDVLCSENTVDIYNSKTIQSSMGSIFRVNISYANLQDELSTYKGTILGAVLDGENIYKTELPKNGMILIGSESHGISEVIKPFITNSIKIPQFGEAESLNAAVACGIICSEIKRN